MGIEDPGLVKDWVQAFEKVGYFTFPTTILLCILMGQFRLVNFFRPLHTKRFAFAIDPSLTLTKFQKQYTTGFKKQDIRFIQPSTLCGYYF